MGYYRYTLKCKKCGEQWGSFFCSVDMTQGAQDCPKCGDKDPEKIADAWEFTDTKTGNKFWH